MVELTREQHNIAEELADAYHLVMVDRQDDGSVILTPANFCIRCGGDTFIHLGEVLVIDCPGCEGSGGIPAVHTPITVQPGGECGCD